MAQRNGTGMLPREVMNRFALLPLEEEGRLNDMPLRENFIERVFAYGGKPGFPLGSLPTANCTTAWTQMLDKERTPGGLVKFHTAHKLTLMAHSPKHHTEMGPRPLESAVAWHYTEMARRGAGAASSQMRASGTGTN